MEAPFILPVVGSACLLAFYGLTVWQAISADMAVKIIGVTATSYFIALMMSIATYRLFFHRLRNCPGPFWAGVTKLYHAYLCVHESNFRILARWHEKYGPVVRVGMQ